MRERCQSSQWAILRRLVLNTRVAVKGFQDPACHVLADGWSNIKPWFDLVSGAVFFEEGAVVDLRPEVLQIA